jgi:hypothetical protein
MYGVTPSAPKGPTGPPTILPITRTADETDEDWDRRWQEWLHTSEGMLYQDSRGAGYGQGSPVTKLPDGSTRYDMGDGKYAIRDAAGKTTFYDSDGKPVAVPAVAGAKTGLPSWANPDAPNPGTTTSGLPIPEGLWRLSQQIGNDVYLRRFGPQSKEDRAAGIAADKVAIEQAQGEFAGGSASDLARAAHASVQRQRDQANARYARTATGAVDYTHLADGSASGLDASGRAPYNNDGSVNPYYSGSAPAGQVGVPDASHLPAWTLDAGPQFAEARNGPDATPWPAAWGTGAGNPNAGGTAGWQVGVVPAPAPPPAPETGQVGVVLAQRAVTNVNKPKKPKKPAKP